jgi:hypothetical protein
MKRRFPSHVLLASLLAGVAFSASAQVGFTTQPTVQDTLHPDLATRDVRDHNCLRETGSLVTTAQNQKTLRQARARGDARVEVKCAGYGQAFTQDDIRSTGATDVSEALRQLSPVVH